MGLSPEEIKALLADFTTKFGRGYTNKDPQILADCFDPDGVVIEAGDKAYYGREALVKYYTEFFVKAWNFEVSSFYVFTRSWDFQGITDHHWSATDDAQYLTHSNNAIVVKPDGTKQGRRQESIYKRQPDGSYLMYSQLLKWL